jgi:DNA-binding transcriptional MerR regulator
VAYTVKAVSDLAGISIRTLHYYDEIGLLKPAETNPSGYRIYTEEDLERLQQVLFFRELDFSLLEIKEILHSPDFDRRRALLDHKQMLLQRQERMARLIASVDRTLAAMERGIQMDEKELFDGFEPSQYEEEVKQRWGGTKEYAESAERTKRYTKADWTVIKQEMQDISGGVAGLMDRSPADPAVQEWVRKWHQTINDRFYTCSLEIFRGLGDMYVQDERFTANYEKVKPGLAQFMRAAMHAYCDKLEGK